MDSPSIFPNVNRGIVQVTNEYLQSSVIIRAAAVELRRVAHLVQHET